MQKIKFSYVLYEKPSLACPGKWYSGRTGPGIGNPAGVLARRDSTHERNVDHGPAVIAAYIQTHGLVTKAAYAQKGREQQLIDFHGGFKPAQNGVPAYQLGLTNSTNSRREIGEYNPQGKIYWRTSNDMFRNLAPYTGANEPWILDYVAPDLTWFSSGKIVKVAPPTPIYPFAP